jgi:hypothetical protein
MVGLAIDARRQRYPHERPYSYAPLRGQRVEWSLAEKQSKYGHYWLKDIVI